MVKVTDPSAPWRIDFRNLQAEAMHPTWRGVIDCEGNVTISGSAGPTRGASQTTFPTYFPPSWGFVLDDFAKAAVLVGVRAAETYFEEGILEFEPNPSAPTSGHFALKRVSLKVLAGFIQGTPAWVETQEAPNLSHQRNPGSRGPWDEWILQRTENDLKEELKGSFIAAKVVLDPETRRDLRLLVTTSLDLEDINPAVLQAKLLSGDIQLGPNLFRVPCPSIPASAEPPAEELRVTPIAVLDRREAERLEADADRLILEHHKEHIHTAIQRLASRQNPPQDWSMPICFQVRHALEKVQGSPGDQNDQPPDDCPNCMVWDARAERWHVRFEGHVLPPLKGNLGIEYYARILASKKPMTAVVLARAAGRVLPGLPTINRDELSEKEVPAAKSLNPDEMKSAIDDAKKCQTAVKKALQRAKDIFRAHCPSLAKHLQSCVLSYGVDADSMVKRRRRKTPEALRALDQFQYRDGAGAAPPFDWFIRLPHHP